MSEEEPIFLSNGIILDWDLSETEKHMYGIIASESSTKLIEYLGLNKLDEIIDPYWVIASAAQYVADIVPFGRNSEKQTVKTKPERKILFSGSIAIYKFGIISGTEFSGYNLVKKGDIWTATKNLDTFRGEQGLRNLILDRNYKDVKQIEGIVLGYEIQEKMRRDDEFRRMIEASGSPIGLTAGRSGPC